MLSTRNRGTNQTLAAMLMLAGSCIGLAHQPLMAQEAAPAPQPPVAGAAQGSLDRVAALLEAGRLVEAKASLEQFFRSGGSEAQRSKALSLLRTVDAKLRTADPVEISLQRAELAVAEGDLLAADRWAKTVSGKATTGQPQRQRADAVLAEVATRRGEVAPLIPGLIQQANADFEAGRYAAAKASILAVLRSGVEIDPEVSHRLEIQQLRIVEIERERGQNFNVAAESGLAMLAQPGNVRRPGQSEEPAAQEGQPPASEPEPLPPMPADQPVEQPPAPPAAPADITPPPPPAPPAPTQDELVRTAMRAEAQRILTEADQAYDAARYNEASNKYELALAQFRSYLDTGDINRAQERLNDARARLESNRSGNIGAEVVGLTKVRREQAQAEFDNWMAQAIAALNAGDTDTANSNQARAGLAIRNARDLFTESEFAEYDTQLTKLKNDIGAKRDAMAIQSQAAQEQNQTKKARELEQSRMNERDRKVNESIDRIRALQQERKYDEALQVVDQVLFLDPNNPTGLLLQQILRDIVIYVEYNQNRADKEFRFARLSLLNEKAMNIPTDMVEFPNDWPEKTFQRGEQSAFNEPRENRQVLADLATKKLPADFNENKLEDVLTYVQTLTHIDSDVDWESLEAIGIRKDTPISLKLSPLPVQTLLDRVLVKAAGGDQFRRAGWTVDRGVLVIGSQEELNKHRSLVIYNIQDLLFDIPNHTEVPEIDLNSVLQQSQGGGGGQSPFQDADEEEEDRPTREEKIRQVQDIITQNVDYEGWADNGGDVGRIQELNGSLIITNTPKNHREIVGLLSKLREIRNMQINVETKFLLVNQGWFEHIGFDLDVVINANNNQVRAARAVDPSVQPGDFFDFSGQAGAGGSRGLQRTITGQGPTGGTPAPIDNADRTVQAVTNPAGWSPVAASQNSFGLSSGLAAAAAGADSLASTVLAAAPALGIAGQFLDDVQVDFLIAATQADQRSVQLTAPRLTFTNGQTANIFVVTQQAFVSDLQPVVGDSAVGFDPTVSVASEGVTMLVEGVISADRRYVTMNIDAGVARIDGFAREAVTAVAGGQLVNSSETGSFIQLPTITVTRVRTTATVPDEGTVLLGGQRLITEVEVETGVPVLSKIPVVNRFFTNRVESKEEQTLLILVKPTILIQTELEEKSYPGLIDQVRTGIGGN